MLKPRYYLIALIIIFITEAVVLKFINYSQTKIIVAVVDTGIDLNQTKLRFAAIQGFNVLDPNKSPQDDNGHGTQIASVINFLEPRIKILPIKAIPKSGVATKQELARGIIVAVDLGAKIINISAGVASSSIDLENAVKYAEEKNVIIVAAVGGNGTGIEYPAAYPVVLAIGGVDRNENRLQNSNIGSELDAVALGEYATIGLRGECKMDAGTSLAAPIVSVYAARIFIDNPNLKSEEVRNILLNSAIDIEKPGKDELTGYGLLKQERNILICAN